MSITNNYTSTGYVPTSTGTVTGTLNASGGSGASSASCASSASEVLASYSFNELLTKFEQGNMTLAEFVQGLKFKNIIATTKEDDIYTTVTFKNSNKNYTIRCTNVACASATDSKKATTYTDTSLRTTYKFSTEVINKYFDAVEENTDSTGKSTVTKYVFKPDCGYTSPIALRSALFAEAKKQLIMANFLENDFDKDSTSTNALYKVNGGKTALSSTNYTSYTKEINAQGSDINELKKKALNKLIKDFSCGNLMVNQLDTILNSIGVENKSRTTTNGNYEVTFKFEGKNYKITCNTAAAAKGGDAVHNKAYVFDSNFFSKVVYSKIEKIKEKYFFEIDENSYRLKDELNLSEFLQEAKLLSEKDLRVLESLGIDLTKSSSYEEITDIDGNIIAYGDMFNVEYNDEEVNNKCQEMNLYSSYDLEYIKTPLLRDYLFTQVSDNFYRLSDGITPEMVAGAEEKRFTTIYDVIMYDMEVNSPKIYNTRKRLYPSTPYNQKFKSIDEARTELTDLLKYVSEKYAQLSSNSNLSGARLDSDLKNLESLLGIIMYQATDICGNSISEFEKLNEIINSSISDKTLLSKCKSRFYEEFEKSCNLVCYYEVRGSSYRKEYCKENKMTQINDAFYDIQQNPSSYSTIELECVLNRYLNEASLTTSAKSFIKEMLTDLQNGVDIETVLGLDSPSKEVAYDLMLMSCRSYSGIADLVYTLDYWAEEFVGKDSEEYKNYQEKLHNYIDSILYTYKDKEISLDDIIREDIYDLNSHIDKEKIKSRLAVEETIESIFYSTIPQNAKYIPITELDVRFVAENLGFTDSELNELLRTNGLTLDVLIENSKASFVDEKGEPKLVTKIDILQDMSTTLQALQMLDNKDLYSNLASSFEAPLVKIQEIFYANLENFSLKSVMEQISKVFSTEEDAMFLASAPYAILAFLEEYCGGDEELAVSLFEKMSQNETLNLTEYYVPAPARARGVGNSSQKEKSGFNKIFDDMCEFAAKATDSTTIEGKVYDAISTALDWCPLPWVKGVSIAINVVLTLGAMCHHVTQQNWDGYQTSTAILNDIRNGFQPLIDNLILEKLSGGLLDKKVVNSITSKVPFMKKIFDHLTAILSAGTDFILDYLTNTIINSLGIKETDQSKGDSDVGDKTADTNTKPTSSGGGNGAKDPGATISDKEAVNSTPEQLLEKGIIRQVKDGKVVCYDATKNYSWEVYTAGVSNIASTNVATATSILATLVVQGKVSLDYQISNTVSELKDLGIDDETLAIYLAEVLEAKADLELEHALDEADYKEAIAKAANAGGNSQPIWDEYNKKAIEHEEKVKRILGEIECMNNLMTSVYKVGGTVSFKKQSLATGTENERTIMGMTISFSDKSPDEVYKQEYYDIVSEIQERYNDRTNGAFAWAMDFSNEVESELYADRKTEEFFDNLFQNLFTQMNIWQQNKNN